MPSLRCPRCHNRVIRDRENYTVFLVKQIEVRKADGQAIAICQDCQEAVVIPQAMLKTLMFLRPGV